MGASFAPSMANPSILIHLIQNKIYDCKAIKLNLRMVDDTILIIDHKYNIDINVIYKQFYPQFLQCTSQNLQDNCIQFLDIKLIKMYNTLNYLCN